MKKVFNKLFIILNIKLYFNKNKYPVLFIPKFYEDKISETIRP